jgi:hypothetical protein
MLPAMDTVKDLKSPLYDTDYLPHEKVFEWVITASFDNVVTLQVHVYWFKIAECFHCKMLWFSKICLSQTSLGPAFEFGIEVKSTFTTLGLDLKSVCLP